MRRLKGRQMPKRQCLACRLLLRDGHTLHHRSPGRVMPRVPHQNHAGTPPAAKRSPIVCRTIQACRVVPSSEELDLGFPASPPASGCRCVRPKRRSLVDRLHLCRAEGRLRLQPGACRSRRDAEEDARREDRRRGKGAGDRRCPEDHGEHDPARWRDPAVPHQLRLFRPVHAAHGGEVSEDPVPPLRRAVAEGQAPDERRILFRLYRHVPVPSTASPPATRPRARSSASSPPSRSRRC